ncbi:class I SAM-dependent methyltransferase [Lutibacter holmesii]|uniref:Class I SAM-dependent methyltransferase n=1 Tax=Lutibacter holmesii TaxID=1137985 RepID=A0ABW3WRQ2_9FLAO
MNISLLKQAIGNIDIYLIDQILKERFKVGDKILDAGCGKGRNLKWFYNTGFQIYGIDLTEECIDLCKENFSAQKDHFKVASLNSISFDENYFEYIICNAVLHFAIDFDDFNKMFSNLLSVLKPNGMLFIRMASNFGMELNVVDLGKGNYLLPDGSQRFLLTAEILDELKDLDQISFVDDVKTTIVEGKRCMTTLILKKL